MRRLLGAMRRESDDVDLAPSARPRLRSSRCSRRCAGPACGCELEVEGEPVALPRALDLSAYRIVQEGLTNVLKHANATRADVKVVLRAA